MKFSKIYQYRKNNMRKVCGYRVCISKEILASSNLDEDDELQIRTENKRIIIEKR